jgi:multidrug efflux pump subunit AcrA (membrane-fusion protein)
MLNSLQARWAAAIFLIGVFTILPLQGDDTTETTESTETVTADAEAAAEVDTETVERGPFRVEVTLTGVFEASQMSEIKIETEEWTDLEVVEAAPHGSMVQPGELLLKLKTEDLDEEIQNVTYTAEIGRMDVTLAELELQSNEHSLPLEIEAAERTLTASREDMAYYNEIGEQQTIRNSEMSLLSSQASLEASQEELEQLEQMYAADDLTEETEEIILKRARQDVEMSQYYYDSSVLSHDQLMEFDLQRTRFHMEDALRRAEIDSALTETRLTNALEESRIALEQQRVTQRETEERLAKLQADRGLLEVYATMAGRVLYGECNRGTWSNTATLLESLKPEGTVTADSVLMTIIPAGPLFVRTDVTEANLRHVVSPQEVRIVPTIAPDAKWMGAARSFNPIAIGDDLYDATFSVAIGAAPVEVMPGMGCEVIVTARYNAEALTLPSEVIFDDPATSGGKIVYVKTDAGHEARSVVVGLSNDSRTEILEGLVEGDVVLSEEP